jgi:hypothetical protein
MNTIYKYNIPIQDEFVLSMPVNAEILCVQCQFGKPHIWVRLEDNAMSHNRQFFLVGTGHQISDKWNDPNSKYIGTFQMHDGELVFHLFQNH